MKPFHDWYRNLGAGMRGALFAVLAVVVIILATVLWAATRPGPMDFARGQKIALADYRGADPTGVPAMLANASLVKRGEYLAHAADCLACHTAQGGQAYAGGLAFNLPIGTLYSTNITPDKETGIGDYSDTDFLRAVHHGVRRDGARLYPAMPFASYIYMSDADALAIKAYLFSLAPVRAAAPSGTLTFPFNQRSLISMWAWLFAPDTHFQADAAQSAAWNRGAYVAEALAHCGECHTPRNVAYALNNRKKFAGGTTSGWRAYNISGDKGTGIGAWRDDELFAYLSTGHADGHGTASGPMGEAVDHSLSPLEADDIRAVIAYVRSVPAAPSPDLPATSAPPAPASHREGAAVADLHGKRLFEGTCESCHSWSGVSAITPFATLTGARAVNDPGGTNVAQIVISGTRRQTPQGIVSMPAFGSTYSNAEIAAVTNYVTARFGSRASQVSEKDVAALRKEAAQ